MQLLTAAVVLPTAAKKQKQKLKCDKIYQTKLTYIDDPES